MSYTPPVKIKPDEFVKRLVKISHPDYRGRKFRLKTISPDESIDLTSYWDGGSRDYFAAVQLATMQSCSVPQNGTPYDKQDYSRSSLPAGVIIVKRGYCQGHDIGITIIVRADDLNPSLLPEVTS